MNDCPHAQQARTCEICELEAERDRLLAKLAHAQVSTVMANSAADAAAEVVGNMAEKLSTMLAERNRLRARMLELESQVGEREQHLRDAFKDTRAERDRLRAVVDAARTYLALVDSTRVTAQDRQAGMIELYRALRQLELDGSAEATDE